MRKIWTLAMNDLRLTTGNRGSFIWMLAFPLAMMWFFGNMSGGGGGELPRISLTVIDEDGGWLARAFVEELNGEQVNLQEVTADEFEALEQKVRTLRIPAGFTAKVLAGEQQELRLEKEAASNEEFGVAAEVHVLRSIVRALGNLTEMDTGSVTTVTDAENREAYRRLSERPQLVTVAISTAGRGRPVPAGTRQSVPGIMTMTVLMMTLIYGGVFLTHEKQTGMLRRQAGLPITRRDILLGKLVGRMMVAGLQIALLVPAGKLIFGISWGNSLAGLLLVLLSFSIAVAGLSTLLGAVLSTPEQASGLGWILSMVLAGLGGCWWPAEVMPEWMQTLGHLFPTAWAMDAFHSLISFGHGVDAVALPAAVLIGFGGLFSLLGARFLKLD